MDLQSILIQKSKKDELGHFYILKTQKVIEDKSFLKEWTLELLRKYCELNSIESVLNHEDILVIENQSIYKLEDFNDLFSFLNYKANRIDRKFLIIDNAENIKPQIANKLLKTLEEPPIKCTIFMLNSNSVSLLETITSRAIQLRVTTKDQVEHSQYNIIEQLKEKILTGLSCDEFINSFRYDKEQEKELYPELANWLITNSAKTEFIWEVQNLNKQYSEDILYNTTSLNRLFKLYQTLCSIFK